MSYRTLEIWQLARDLSIEIHRMTLESLPRLECMRKHRKFAAQRNPLNQIVSKDMDGEDTSLSSSAFSTYAHASCDETIDHLETLHETGSLTDNGLYERLHQKLNQLGGKLNQFIQSV